MRKINWKLPVETVFGEKLIVVREGCIKGLPAMPSIGRNAGEDAVWKYDSKGVAGVSFLPDIRNVKGY